MRASSAIGSRAALTVVAMLLFAPERSSPAADPNSGITVEYPLEGAVFPPDFAAPTFRWRDSSAIANQWMADVSFADGSKSLHAELPGELLVLGPIDPRCTGATNEPPRLTPEQARTRTWKPGVALWAAMTARSVARPATVTITGYDGKVAVSVGRVTISTSPDPVGAPIFFRDVPLMPSELKKGEIKPISPKLLPIVRWSLRYVGESESRVLMEGIHTCANCHSFSRDGRTLAMDLDGPHNDKGLYAIVPVSRHTSIGSRDVISWKAFRSQMNRDQRIGFMSQISPDGRYVITATRVQYYVANFKDYRFLQAFYPTRGVLAWYDRADGRMRTLPGADDPRYVQANAIWTPDGRQLVFARAEAKDAYPAGAKMAEFAGDPNEVQIRYDLYTIPFNAGRGGRPTPIGGASKNGMSNSFPKVSPDGRWIVFVQSRNGQLMRPDGKLYIVPAAGGQARLMRCNTPLMNSWHSFSPNGRWLVFSSKSWSPYTQMFLTHIDDDGNDTPAILIENATAANRAVNIPEFVNVGSDGLQAMDAPAAEFYRRYDVAWDLTEKGQFDAAIPAWNSALELDPDDPGARTNLAALLFRRGDVETASSRLQEIVRGNPEFIDARVNYGVTLLHTGRVDEAIVQFRKTVDLDSTFIEAYANLGMALVVKGRFADAGANWRSALQLDPKALTVLSNLAWLLATCPDSRTRNGAEAVELAERALAISGGNDMRVLDIAGAAYAEQGRFADALKSARHAVLLATDRNDQRLANEIMARIALYRANKAFRDSQ